MKKLTALFTIVAMLVCMFAIAPTASAVEHPPHTGETVTSHKALPYSNGRVIIHCELTCWDGWLDGTFGSDYVEARLSSSIAIPCSASIDLFANYVRDATTVIDGNFDTFSILGPQAVSVSLYPETDRLNSGSAGFEVSHTTYGEIFETLFASCPSGT